MTELHYQSATQLAGLIRRKKIGCVELLDHFLKRVEQYNPKLNAIIWMDQDKARKRARAADSALKKGKRFGALHGVPMTIKESFDVEGYPSTYGDPAFKNYVPSRNSLVAQRMIAAGVNLFGKKNFMGTFVPPFAVINDSIFLESLEHRDRIGGVVEAVKVALLKDEIARWTPIIKAAAVKSE